MNSEMVSHYKDSMSFGANLMEAQVNDLDAAEQSEKVKKQVATMKAIVKSFRADVERLNANPEAGISKCSEILLSFEL